MLPRMSTRFTKTLWTGLALVALVAAGTTTALAQDDEKKPAVHESKKGYTIKSPTGWEVVSGELEGDALEKLPTNIREHYDPKTTDVMFMDLSSGKDDEFKDNLNVVVLEEPVPVNDELIGELKDILSDQYNSLFEDFQLQTFEKTKFGENEAIRIEATYKLLGYDLFLYQALMSGESKSLVITCTMDQSRKADRMQTCTDAFGSVAFK